MTTVTIELPDELVARLGSSDDLASQARRALILDLLRRGEISQGTTARLLGITRYDLLDLLAAYEIPSGPLTAEEMQQDIENARRYSEAAHADASD